MVGSSAYPTFKLPCAVAAPKPKAVGAAKEEGGAVLSAEGAAWPNVKTPLGAAGCAGAESADCEAKKPTKLLKNIHTASWLWREYTHSQHQLPSALGSVTLWPLPVCRLLWYDLWRWLGIKYHKSINPVQGESSSRIGFFLRINWYKFPFCNYP